MQRKLKSKISNLSPIKNNFLIIILFIFYDIFVFKKPFSFFLDIFGGRYFVNYFLSIIILISLVIISRSLFKINLIGKFIGSIILFLPLAIQTIHYSFYKTPLSAYGIRFFFSQPALSFQLGFENINFIKIIYFTLFSFIVIYLLNNNLKKYKFNYLINSIAAVFAISLSILCGMNWYLILEYQNATSAFYAAIPETGRSLYFKQLKKDKPNIPKAVLNKKMPNILWIIGESVAKSHMSLYGYHRKTTPNLDLLAEKGDLIPFNNVVSIGPHTLISVPYMLVGKQNIDPEGRIYSSPIIFEYAKARGYNTAFISSQDLRWKNFDQLSGKNIVDYYRAGTDFSSNVSVSKGADDLKVLNESILPHLSEIKPPFLFVAHMDGSHYPYSSHSEKKFKIFFPESNPNGTNAYDNTIVYSDIYLSKLIEEARKKDPNIWIFYTTDHGQSVELAPMDKNVNLPKLSSNANSSDELKNNNIEEKNENIIFNQGYDKEIIHNAFFVVPPKNYHNVILHKQNAPVAQSDIFATILDLLEFNTPVTKIDGLSLLKTIPTDRLRITTGFVVTNDNIPEAQITLPDLSSYFVDFTRKSISFSGNKNVLPFDKAPNEFVRLFDESNNNNSFLSAEN
ncbi:sulfatase-like hydrolase/transferase [Pigmentibacter sp. JX0631]|uniref:sulfatase-like hydrolase/transferase n=1 Tax=Pigmentibacter sp. JX0631 TaxID=2976982 RepID=UPI002468636D|nr:sulfatase-like hydrolase/transferase [Pigmentibacter sp. JX0631]WGL59302.1 sulfatase-like hydrolase/transferase [Pigmentibacter sp. JX0631]